MRGRLPLVVLLGSALAFLVSLYLPWKQVQAHAGGEGVLGLLNLFAFAGDEITGWASGVGDAAALVAVALAAATIAALVRPRLADRMPLGAGGLLTAYLALAVVALLRQRFAFDARVNHVDYPWAYGAYLGVAAGLAALLAAAVLRGRKLVPRRPIEGVGWILGLGLLVSFLLPWHRVPYLLAHQRHTTFTSLGLGPSAVLAAAMVAVGGTRKRGEALWWAGAAVFALGALGFGGPSAHRAYGFWLALGFALALLTVSLLVLRECPRPARPQPLDAVIGCAATVFVASLFLPWQRLCVPHGLCISESGWTLPGSSAAMLAALAGLAAVLPSHANRIAELAAGTGLLVATAGFTMGLPGSELHLHFAYGSVIGFSAVALLVALAAGRPRRPQLDRQRLLARLLPIAASFALLADVAIAWWSVLPSDWGSEAVVLRGWFAVAGLLLSLHLLWCWLRRVRGSARVRLELTLLPQAVLALVALELIVERDAGMTWGGGILVGLCLLLAVLGWIEARTSLENLRLPEILRVDRLPGAET